MKNEHLAMRKNKNTDAVSVFKKIIAGPTNKLCLTFMVISMFSGPLFKLKLHFLCTVLLSGLQSSPGALSATEWGSAR